MISASWCPPCQQIRPIFEKLANDFPSITFLKVDIDNFPEPTEAFGVNSVPTFFFLNGEDVKSHFSGADKNRLQKDLESLQKA